jgi:hypothetical protein
VLSHALSNLVSYGLTDNFKPKATSQGWYSLRPGISPRLWNQREARAGAPDLLTRVLRLGDLHGDFDSTPAQSSFISAAVVVAIVAQAARRTPGCNDSQMQRRGCSETNHVWSRHHLVSESESASSGFGRALTVRFQMTGIPTSGWKVFRCGLIVSGTNDLTCLRSKLKDSTPDNCYHSRSPHHGFSGDNRSAPSQALLVTSLAHPHATPVS